MTPAKPLLSMFDDLRVDADERLAFTSDPEGYLASHGWADLDPGELREALGFARESMPLDVAVTVPDLPDAEGSTTALVGEYLGAVAPLDDADDTADDTTDELADLEDFGADAMPLDVEPVALRVDGHDPLEVDHDAEPLTIDLGPADGPADDGDDADDPDDDPLDL